MVLPRDSTKTWPLELTETPETSPRYMLGGSFRGLGTESKAMTGTFCCASAEGANRNNNPTSQCFMLSPPCVFCFLSLQEVLVYAPADVHLCAACPVS